jgi:hypothetical protein
MTLNEFLIHKDFINQREDIEYANYKDSEAKNKN